LGIWWFYLLWRDAFGVFPDFDPKNGKKAHKMGISLFDLGTTASFSKKRGPGNYENVLLLFGIDGIRPCFIATKRKIDVISEQNS